MFGVRLPVEAGKGYSFEVRPRQMPRHALLLLDPHVGCSPFGDRLRIDAARLQIDGAMDLDTVTFGQGEIRELIRDVVIARGDDDVAGFEIER